MRILIDRNGIQARQHLADKQRLCAFVTELLSGAHGVAFSSDSTIQPRELHDSDVLIITTRYHRKGCDYSAEEIRRIWDFVLEGGGLFLMTNHGDSPGNPCDTREYDAKLAARFGVEVERTYFEGPAPGVRTILSGVALDSSHPIIAGTADTNRVRSIVTNTCCSLVVRGARGIVALSTEMVDRRRGLSPSGRYFAYALEAGSGLSPEHKGRVVVTADSGLVGNACTSEPGPGLIDRGDNMVFIKNAILWLGAQLSA